MIYYYEWKVLLGLSSYVGAKLNKQITTLLSRQPVILDHYRFEVGHVAICLYLTLSPEHVVHYRISCIYRPPLISAPPF